MVDYGGVLCKIEGELYSLSDLHFDDDDDEDIDTDVESTAALVDASSSSSMSGSHRILAKKENEGGSRSVGDDAVNIKKRQKDIGFTIMTFNVLADFYARSWFFPYCQKEYLKWEYRSIRLKILIREADPDILCLQEVQAVEGLPPSLHKGNNHVEWFQRWLGEAGYDCAYYPKKDNGGNDLHGEVIGNLIAWKRHVFRQLEIKKISINKSLTTKCGQKAVEEYVSNKYGCSAVFVMLQSIDGYKLAVATSHFSAPRFENAYPAKLAQLMQAIALGQEYGEFITRNREKHGNFGVVFCGDTNAIPDSEVYEIFTNSRLLSSVAEKQFVELSTLTVPPSIPLKFVSAPKYLIGREPGFTTQTNKFRDTVDYVFHSSSGQVIGVKEEGNASEVSGECIQPTRARFVQLEVEKTENPQLMPNKAHPSDHAAILVEYSVAREAIDDCDDWQ